MTVNEDQKPSAVLVTGCSSGIGEACALELDRLGYRVFAGVRNEADGERLKQKAVGRLSPVILDITDADMVTRASESISANLNGDKLVGLVNNAGIVVCGPLEILPLDELRKQLEVNVVGQIGVTQAFLPMLKEAKGRIVNMSSVSGGLAAPYLGPYCGSKHALEALTDALRIELRNSGVTVSLVEPASVTTPIWDKSKTASEQMAQTVSEEAMKPYRSDLDAFAEAAKKLSKGQVTMQQVVGAVVHALTAKRPKTRYYISWTTQFCFRAFKMVPDRIRDWIIRRGLGLR